MLLTGIVSPQFSFSALSQEFKTLILSFSFKLHNTARSSQSSLQSLILPTYSFFNNCYMFFQSLVFQRHFIVEENVILSHALPLATGAPSSLLTRSSMPENLTWLNNPFTDSHFLEGLLPFLGSKTILIWFILANIIKYSDLCKEKHNF